MCFDLPAERSIRTVDTTVKAAYHPTHVKGEILGAFGLWGFVGDLWQHVSRRGRDRAFIGHEAATGMARSTCALFCALMSLRRVGTVSICGDGLPVARIHARVAPVARGGK